MAQLVLGSAATAGDDRADSHRPIPSHRASPSSYREPAILPDSTTPTDFAQLGALSIEKRLRLGKQPVAYKARVVKRQHGAPKDAEMRPADQMKNHQY